MKAKPPFLHLLNELVDHHRQRPAQPMSQWACRRTKAVDPTDSLASLKAAVSQLETKLNLMTLQCQQDRLERLWCLRGMVAVIGLYGLVQLIHGI